jgi:hypothetical protein
LVHECMILRLMPCPGWSALLASTKLPPKPCRAAWFDPAEGAQSLWDVESVCQHIACCCLVCARTARMCIPPPQLSKGVYLGAAPNASHLVIEVTATHDGRSVVRAAATTTNPQLSSSSLLPRWAVVLQLALPDGIQRQHFRPACTPHRHCHCTAAATHMHTHIHSLEQWQRGVLAAVVTLRRSQRSVQHVLDCMHVCVMCCVHMKAGKACMCHLPVICMHFTARLLEHHPLKTEVASGPHADNDAATVAGDAVLLLVPQPAQELAAVNVLGLRGTSGAIAYEVAA